MKRTRTPFTDLQLLELGNYFKTNKFLTVENSQKQKQTINSSEIVPMEVSYFHPEEHDVTNYTDDRRIGLVQLRVVNHADISNKL